MIALAYFTFGIPKATGTVSSLADSEALRAARITLLPAADLEAVIHAFKKEKFRIKADRWHDDTLHKRGLATSTQGLQQNSNYAASCLNQSVNTLWIP